MAANSQMLAHCCVQIVDAAMSHMSLQGIYRERMM